jgi:hypothetical protein
LSYFCCKKYFLFTEVSAAVFAAAVAPIIAHIWLREVPSNQKQQELRNLQQQSLNP